MIGGQPIKLFVLFCVFMYFDLLLYISHLLSYSARQNITEYCLAVSK